MSLGLALAALVLFACSEKSDSDTTGLINTWKQAGLTPTVFLPLKVESLQPGECKQGKVDEVETMLCQYPDASAARAAQPAGLAHVGETTGFALTAGSHLLIVADRDGADPTGRKINQIASVFRKYHEDAKAAAGKGGEQAKNGEQAENDEGAKKASGEGKKGKGGS